ncbi:MAG: class I SAM-dependent methyltransferase [Nitrospiraceae bacterium]|nr:class I SAM-dependent methyltransferase [Nitrospiraceae bacterium]
MQTVQSDFERDRLEPIWEQRKIPVPQNIYGLSNPGQLFMLQERERGVLDILREMDRDVLRNGKILEVGCGSGVWIRDLVRWGANPGNITGVELLPERAATAQRLSPAGVCIHCGDARTLMFPDESFDLVIQSTVFTSILDPLAQIQLAKEMLRVLKQDGIILWYDFYRDNPWNPDVRGVKKREILRLFPACHVQLRSMTLLPPLVRMVAPVSWLACQVLSLVPLLRTHYLGTIRKGLRYE